MEQIKGKTKAGFAFSIDPEAMNDMEFLENLADVEENPAKLPKLITALLGKEQKRALYDHYRDENGRVPVDAVSSAFVEMLKSSSHGKN